MRSPLRLALLGTLLLPVGGIAEDDGALPEGMLPTGEVFRYRPTNHDYRVFRDPATGRKAFVGPDGAAHETVEQAVKAEEAALSPLRRVVHRELWDAVEDQARKDETLRVFLVLKDNPLPAAAASARARIAEPVQAKIGRLRAILARIAPLRAEDDAGELQLGHRFEEEARLMTAAEREESRLLRREVHRMLEGARIASLEAARAIADPALDELSARVVGLGARVLGRSAVLQALAVEVPAGRVADLIDPQVRLVLPHGTRKVGLNTSVGTIGASSWTGAGYDGSTLTEVAVLDTGIDSLHPGLSGIFANQGVFLAVGSQASGFADSASSTDDVYGHGTHVAGIVMGQDATYKGVAPGGKLLNAKCGYRYLFSGNYYGSLEDADIMAAGDWSATQGASVMSCSFGGGGTTDGSSGLAMFFDAIVEDLGISVAVAAGNSGPTGGTVGIPGDAFDVITVGSFNDNGSAANHSDNSISSFSSRGPLADGRRKPDLAAPGSQISSTNPAWEGGASDYVAWDGTSMATPHVAGAIALLDDYAAAWRPEGIKALLTGTTRNTSPYPVLPDNNWGTGGLNLAAAYTARGALLEGTYTSNANPVAFYRGASLANGQRATLCWSREVLANGSGAPTTYRSAADLDLYVYEEVDGTDRGSSTASLDSLEQVKVTGATVFPILKVKRFGAFPSGQTSLHWALATETTTAPQVLLPPSLSCSFSTFPSYVGAAQSFTVTVTASNSGGLQAMTPSVALSLPAGFAVTEGANPQTLVSLTVSGSAQATWTVQAPGGGSGSREFSAVATSTCYGEDFASPSASRSLTLDAQGPSCSIQLSGGRTAVNGTSVTVDVTASDALSGVDAVRLRNQGDAWGAWQPYAASYPWTLAPGEGTHVVEAQARDGAGNASTTASDAIVIDVTVPGGTFVVQGGSPYVMPWEDLLATLDPDDGLDGSGVTAFRHRWGTGTPSAWTELLGGDVAPVTRPASTGLLVVQGQFRDAADNVSAYVPDSIYVVEEDPPALTAVSSWKGALAPGGDVDAFTLGGVAGDVVSVTFTLKGAKGSDLGISVAMFRPDGARTMAALDPRNPGRAGFRKTILPMTGTYWFVAVPTGADAPAGGALSVTAKASVPPANRRREGTAEPGDGVATPTFDASEGSTMKATLSGPMAGPVQLRAPDGNVVLVAAAAGGDRVVVPPHVLDQSGTWTLLVPASGPVAWRVDLKPPKRGRAVESAD